MIDQAFEVMLLVILGIGALLMVGVLAILAKAVQEIWTKEQE